MKLFAPLCLLAAPALLLTACIPDPKIERSASLDDSAASGAQVLLFVADSQEHQLTGKLLESNSPMSEKVVTPVAQRSPLANVGGSLLLRQSLAFGRREQAALVVHLGDAADISCPDELQTAFDSLEAEAPGQWLLAPGNHDGLLAGTFSTYQPEAPLQALTFEQVYPQAPNEAGYTGTSWRHACSAPGTLGDQRRSNVLTKSDVVGLYLDRLSKRKGALLTPLEHETVVIEGVSVKCEVAKLTLPDFGYVAIARQCPRTAIGKDETKWVGPWAGYIVQKFAVSNTTFVLLDTSSYLNPSAANVGLKGSVSPEQITAADKLLEGAAREHVIIAGHHPLESLNHDGKAWVAKHGNRYVSAHAHKPTNVGDRKIGARHVNELNIGSVLDFPAQAILFRLSDENLEYRVSHAGNDGADSPGFAPECDSERSRWALAPDHYRAYLHSPYIKNLLHSLKLAAPKAPGSPLEIPAGDRSADWNALAGTLDKIRASEGEARQFWACQASYASDATKDESSRFEAVLGGLGFGFDSGTKVEPGWHAF